VVGKVEKICRERMRILFKLASEELPRNPSRSRRYVELIKRISTKNRVRIPKDIKSFLCKQCNLPLIPLKTLKVRIKKRKYVIYRCLNCGACRRFQLMKG